tara:strand:- start:240 stop:683 length:444 start_codon:yes stop_codon:yes gene_type:complete
MSEVSKICITNKSAEEMEDVNTVEVIASKGIVNDRYFNENNDQALQITLIESENIDYYNQISETNIPYISFRRNIITKGIQLNDLVGKEILIGNVKIKGHRLCAPCRYLQEMLKQKNLVKKLLNRGGLRCEILTDGIISVNNPIKQI